MSGGKPAPSTGKDRVDVIARWLEKLAREMATEHSQQLKMMLELFKETFELYQQLWPPKPWAAVSEYQAKSDHWGE